MSSKAAERVAVVTGAASGIGLAAVRELIQSDDETVVIGVDLAECPSELSVDKRVAWVLGDVVLQSTWDAVQKACVQRDPCGADRFISCAADIVVAPFLDTKDHWSRLFEINVLGAVRGMETLIPAMIKRGKGAIAIVCSIVSIVVVDQLSAYSTSKAALLQAVRSAALEYGRKGVRINAVCPGHVDTPMLRGHFAKLPDPEAARRAAERRIPTGHILRPEEIAAVLGFLVSDKASGLSGAAVMVDGGLTTTFDFDSSAT
jgi:NAD(P)-dependent dehydrogenase (short-subunit alcohol dehydrogenase family)